MHIQCLEKASNLTYHQNMSFSLYFVHFYEKSVGKSELLILKFADFNKAFTGSAKTSVKRMIFRFRTVLVSQFLFDTFYHILDYFCHFKKILQIKRCVHFLRSLINPKEFRKEFLEKAIKQAQKFASIGVCSEFVNWKVVQCSKRVKFNLAS